VAESMNDLLRGARRPQRQLAERPASPVTTYGDWIAQLQGDLNAQRRSRSLPRGGRVASRWMEAAPPYGTSGEWRA
jgi:hypothetical protein